MTHVERRERRRALAEEVRSGRTVIQVARKAKMHPLTVRCACAEFKVTPTRATCMSKNPIILSTWVIGKAIIDGKTDRELSEQYEFTKQRINQIRQAMRKAGFEV